MKNRPFLFVLVPTALIIFLGISKPIYAADVFFEVSTVESNSGTTLVEVLLNTEGESVNAIEGSILLDNRQAKIEEVRLTDSLISFWVDRPQAGSYFINLSGIIPGGFVGEKGNFLTLRVRVPSGQTTTIKGDAMRAYKNDGAGTPIPVRVISQKFEAKSGEGGEEAPSRDITPPDSFQPIISRDPNLFDNRWFIVFSTQDKESVVAYYEICEGSKRNCSKGESPYELTNQSGERPVYIKAIDTFGNERIVKAPAPNPRPWYRSIFFFVILGVLVLGGIILWRKIWERLRHA